MERIIWMYGSAGSTESIIFMPHENTRKGGGWQGGLWWFVRGLVLVGYVGFLCQGICLGKGNSAYRKYVAALCIFQQNSGINLEIDTYVRVGMPVPGIRPRVGASSELNSKCAVGRFLFNLIANILGSSIMSPRPR